MLRKKYNLNKVIEQLEKLKKSGKNNINLFELLEEIGFDAIELEYFYKQFIKGRLIYKRE